MTEDRGQALVLVAVLVGLAAAAVTGLRGAGERIVENVLDQRAGEAAVAAAGTAVADLAFARSLALGRELERAETDALASDPVVADAARSAARRLARLHGRADPDDVRVLARGFAIEIHLTLAGRTHVALLEAAP